MSNNWEGHDLNTASAPTGASGIFIQPSDHGTACANAMESTWTGVGGDNGSNILGQNGVDIGGYAWNFPQYGAWWEVYPASSVFVNLTATPGQPFYVETVWLGNGNYQFTWQNMSTGATMTLQAGAYGFDATTADWIAETPSVSGYGITNLINFGSFFWQSSADLSGGKWAYNAGGLYPIALTSPSSGHLLAYPTGPQGGNTQGSFDNIFNECS